MAQQFTSLLKVRRGLKEKRLTTKFQEGEFAFETDTRRLFIGVGDNNNANIGTASIGGINVSNLTFIGPINSNPDNSTEPRAYTGDILLANNKLWRLGDGGWQDISPKTDNTTISYNSNNQLTILPDAFSIGSGPGISTLNNIVSIVNSPDNILQIINSELTLTKNSITSDYLAANFFSSDQFVQIGGSWNIKLNTSYFSSVNDIKIIGVPAGLNSDFTTLADGIEVGSVNAIISDRFRDISGNNGGLSTNNVTDLQISENLLTRNEETDSIVGLIPGIIDIIASNDTASNYNGSISTLFEDEEWTGSSQKTVKVYDTDIVSDMTSLTETELTSAGFIVLNTGSSKTNKNFRKLAIPVFALPNDSEVFYFSNTSGNTYIRGLNLAGVQLYYTDLNSVKTIIPVTEINKNVTSSIYTVKWANVINFPANSTFFAKTITNINQIDISNPPAIYKVTNTGTNVAPTIKIIGYNFGSVASNIVITCNTEDESIIMNLTNANISNLTENQQQLAPTFTNTPPTFNTIISISVAVNGKIANFDL